MGDWLDTGNVANYLKQYRSIEEARAFVQTLGLTNADEWRDYCKGKMQTKTPLPKDIPSCPHKTYRDLGWQGIRHWLGIENVSRTFGKYISIEEARAFTRKLNLKSVAEWRDYCKCAILGENKKPSNIPASPHVIYAEEGWESWGDWLGTGAIATNQRKYLPFSESRNFARSLGLKGAAKWKEFCQRKLLDKGSLPVDVPLNPDTAYANSGWSGWCDWLGSGRARPPKGKYCSFHHARAYVRGLGLKSYAEWRALCKGHSPLLPSLPSDIPNAPDRKYLTQGWAGWGDWLGTGNVRPV